ncbi:MAG: DMT family transporter [Limisphaerales bacterium]
MSWIYLAIAGALEVFWAVGLKYTSGFTRLIPSLLVGTAIAASMFFLALAVRTIPIGTAYAIWVGIGIAGTVVADVTLLNVPLSLPRLFFVLLMAIGIIGLKLTTSGAPS